MALKKSIRQESEYAARLLRSGIRCYTVNPNSRGREIDHQFLVGKWCGHIAKEHVGWDVISISLET